MIRIVLACVIASMMVSVVAATCWVCPQALSDHNDSRFCAVNSYGNASVNQEELSNWNCLHPSDPLVKISYDPCVRPKNTCGTNKCGVAGPTVCAKLNLNKGLGFTTTVFSNICQLNYYNCVFPGRAYTNIESKDPFCKAFLLDLPPLHLGKTE